MGNEGLTKPVSSWGFSWLLSLSSWFLEWTIVASLWLELGRESDKGELSRIGLGSGGPGNRSPPNPERATLLRLLIIELLRLRLAGDCTVHRFEILSLRFNIALCTKPPKPLVGEPDRSGDARPGDRGVRSSEIG